MMMFRLQAALALTLLLWPGLATAQKKPADPADGYRIACIGFYNLENLFDTLDSPATNDVDFTPGGRLRWNAGRYRSKQTNMARVISGIATDRTPDGLALLGVSEVENRKVLEDLVAQPELKSRQYQIVHFDSPDERGIDCGLLYQSKYFKVKSARAVPVALTRDTVVDFTRDILYVSGLFHGEPLHVMVGHWPSRSGGENASVWRRAAAAAVCRQLTDSISRADPGAKIVIMGDLNDDPVNPSLAEVLQAKYTADDLRSGQLYNPMYDLYHNGEGTLAYRDAWNLFDQIIVSQPLVNKKSGGWQLHKAVIYRQPWLLQTDGAFRGYPFRTFVGDLFINGYSDHLPVYVVLLKKGA
jgi:hypothetical protein